MQKKVLLPFADLIPCRHAYGGLHLPTPCAQEHSGHLYRKQVALEKKISLPPFGPETSSAEHFCKVAGGHSHHTASTQTLQKHAHVSHVHPAFLFTRDCEHPGLARREQARKDSRALNQQVTLWTTGWLLLLLLTSLF